MAANIYLEKPQTHSFSKLLTANKNSPQLLAAIKNLDPAANLKLYTWPHLKKSEKTEQFQNSVWIHLIYIGQKNILERERERKREGYNESELC